MTELRTNTSAKLFSTKFSSPPGFLSHVNLDVPDRRFDPAGVFSCGVHLTVAELTAVEAEMMRLFREAFPGETALPHLPFRKHPDGPLTLIGKSSKRPKIVTETYRPLIGAKAGERARLLGFLRPYRVGERAGVTFYMGTVQVVALDARDPRRERKRAEQEALRQAVAIARAKIGGR